MQTSTFGNVWTFEIYEEICEDSSSSCLSYTETQLKLQLHLKFCLDMFNNGNEQPLIPVYLSPPQM